MFGKKQADESKGIFLALEGTDGSGKTTQFELLKKRLEKNGYDVAVFDFPQYEQDSSFFVREYLNGKYGSQEEVGPYTGSLFFALDRYQATPKIRSALADGKIVLTNRFTGSNMAHQGAAFSNNEQLRGYFLWLDQIEFDLLKIPRPDISLVLRVPAEIAQKMVDKKTKRSYTDMKRDIHEADLDHMARSVEVYDNLCRLFPKDFKQIDCTRSGKILNVEKISDLIWQTLDPLLPETGDLKKNIKLQTKSEITDLSKYTTNADDDVFVFNDQLSPQVIAAAFARLSRRGDSLRTILSDEFLEQDSNSGANLIKRILTSYGDDSVSQLLGQYIVIEKASNLLTKRVESGRLAAYLEQSTRYIYFDQKDAKGNYKYHTPKNLTTELVQKYQIYMDQIFDLYSNTVRGLTEHIRAADINNGKDQAWINATRAQACDAARSMLPVATTSSVGIFASSQSIETLVMRLLSDELEESRQTGWRILNDVRKVYPAFYERIDMPDRGLKTIEYKTKTKKQVQRLSHELTQKSFGDDLEPITLTDYWPKNELELADEILYENTSFSLHKIKETTRKLNLDSKRNLIETYIGERSNRRQKPGRALEKVHYSFDVLCDFGIFRDLQRHRMVDGLIWQNLSPRYGYEIPDLIDKFGFSDHFEKAFDLSLELYSFLQKNDMNNEAQYATLLGHKMRWKITFNARQAFHILELRTSQQGHPGYRKLCQQMHASIAEVHPLIAGSMSFVNHNPDTDLNRAESEKKSQKKQKSLL